MKAFIERVPAKVLYDNGTCKVVERQRIQQCRPTGLRPEWTEYQVRQGRKVVARHEFLGPAIKDAQARAREEWDAIGKTLAEHRREDRAKGA